MKTATTPTLVKRAANDRGAVNLGWLQSRHSFSFGEYYDPQHMGFRALRVINDDYVAPSMGFGSHPHKNMEIMTYVIEGALQHRDSMGNGEVIRAGDFQYMRAGRGVVHSEFNASHDTTVHLLQIWVLPREAGGESRYEQLSTLGTPLNGLRLLASGEAREGAIRIEQDAEVYLGRLTAGSTTTATVGVEHGAWIQVFKGEVTVHGEKLGEGDALAVEDADEVTVTASTDAEFLLFVLH